jgi:hypothetical protein
MKSELLGVIDEQYKSSYLKQLEEEIRENRKEISFLTEANLNLRKEIAMMAGDGGGDDDHPRGS